MAHYTYYINLDERGDFYADVRKGKYNDNGKTVFEIRGFDMIEDGFIRHTRDTDGILDYMIDNGLAKAGDTIHC